MAELISALQHPTLHFVERSALLKYTALFVWGCLCLDALDMKLGLPRVYPETQDDAGLRYDGAARTVDYVKWRFTRDGFDGWRLTSDGFQRRALSEP